MNKRTPAVMPPAAEGIITIASPFSVRQTLERLKASVQSRALTIFAQIDHSDEASLVGLDMHPAHVLIFGSPQAGTPLMVASPLLALELPLKVLVWQDYAGQAQVSYDSTAYLASRFAIPAELVKNISGIDGVVSSALQD